MVSFALLASLLLSACNQSPSGATARSRNDPFDTLDLVRARVPTPVKPFTVPDLNGRPLKLDDFGGRVIFLNFWATWCPPCKEEMPSMERVYRRYNARPFTIVALAIDRTPGAVPPFARYYGLTFPIGLDPTSSVANEYGLRALPTTYVIDRRRSVVAVAVGPRDWDGAAAHALIDLLLKEEAGVEGHSRPAGPRGEADKTMVAEGAR